MQFASRTLQQLLVLGIAALVPIQAACLPATLPPDTTTSTTEVSVSSATAIAASLPTAGAVILAQTITSSTTPTLLKRGEGQVASKYTAAGRAILKRDAERHAQAQEKERLAAENDLASSATTLKFGSSAAMQLKKVEFGAHSALKTVESMIHGLAFQKREVPSDVAALTFGTSSA